jgi:hypothetical protein
MVRLPAQLGGSWWINTFETKQENDDEAEQFTPQANSPPDRVAIPA